MVFPSGALKHGTDKEVPSRQKKWAVPGSALGLAAFIPDGCVEPGLSCCCFQRAIAVERRESVNTVKPVTCNPVKYQHLVK